MKTQVTQRGSLTNFTSFGASMFLTSASGVLFGRLRLCPRNQTLAPQSKHKNPKIWTCLPLKNHPYPHRSLSAVLEAQQRVPPAAEQDQPEPVRHESGRVQRGEGVQTIAEEPRRASGLHGGGCWKEKNAAGKGQRGARRLKRGGRNVRVRTASSGRRRRRQYYKKAMQRKSHATNSHAAIATARVGIKSLSCCREIGNRVVAILGLSLCRSGGESRNGEKSIDRPAPAASKHRVLQDSLNEQGQTVAQSDT